MIKKKGQLLDINGAKGDLIHLFSLFSPFKAAHTIHPSDYFPFSLPYLLLFATSDSVFSLTTYVCIWIHTADKVSFEVGRSILTIMITYNHIGWISAFPLTYIFSESKHTASHNWDPMFRCGGNKNTIPSILLASCTLWPRPPLALQLRLHFCVYLSIYLSIYIKP